MMPLDEALSDQETAGLDEFLSSRARPHKYAAIGSESHSRRQGSARLTRCIKLWAGSTRDSTCMRAQTLACIDPSWA